MASLRLRFQAARWLLAVWAACGAAAALAQPPTGSPSAADRGVTEWLVRMQEASRMRSYVGTFVVTSAGAMSSARIWHVSEGGQQIERVEVLTGAPRSTFRRNDEVHTFLPELRVVRTERREALATFPTLLKADDSSIPEFYAARRVGADRVAGFDADVVQLQPRDAMRFGYRVWTEKRSGLVIKVQTLDPDANVLEQSAFSELQLDTPLRADKLAQMMQPPQGWRVERSDAVKTDPAAEGWVLRAAVAGFRPMGCYKRAATPAGPVHWVFSDGLAAVSLFMERYDRQRHVQEGVSSSGATHTLARRMDDWWLTAVGEVPPQTLKAFAQSLERRR